jgi:hypothetical protein
MDAYVCIAAWRQGWREKGNRNGQDPLLTYALRAIVGYTKSLHIRPSDSLVVE